MACTVFGNPITDSTLEGMPNYIGKSITRTDRAHVALKMKNAAGKDVNARTYVENIKKEASEDIYTCCLIYNATGDVVRFATHYDWHGHIGHSPYPVLIENGQWGGFLHVGSNVAGSAGAVVYRGKNEAGNECDWMLSWSNPFNRVIYSNKAYTEIREAHHCENASWDYIQKLVEGSSTQHSDNWCGCSSTVSTGQGNTVIFEAIMTLENA